MINKHIEEIKEKGYTILSQQFEPNQVEHFLSTIKKLYEETKDKICQDVPYLNKTSPNVYNLQNKSVLFTSLLFGLKDVEEILKYFLNDKWYKAIPQDQPNYILRHYGARSSNTSLPFHIDSFIPYVGEEVIAMQVVIMLEDSKFENGATVVIPGSHQSGKYADKNPTEPIEVLEAKAGDIIIWDSRIHHSTTENKTKGTRWALISTFTRWWIKSMFDIPKALPYEIYKQLSPKERSILGFASIPWENEYKGIEMKRGYNELI